MTYDFSRRQFLVAAGAAVALSGARRPAAQEVEATVGDEQRPRVCIFSKHLQYLDYDALAEQCAKLEVDVDLTVRDGGHVLPERVKEDLPKAVDALRAKGVEVPMITTRLQRVEDAHAEAILETAATLGIKFFRVGGHKYEEGRDPLAQLQDVAADLAGLAKLAEDHGMFAGYHNHSGRDNVGAPVWDLLHVFREVGNPHVGSNFDIGHATVEGAFGDWPITTRAMADHMHMVALKDFEWRKDRPRWVPIGEGIVDFAGFFKILHSNSFTGPISLHFEYSTRSNEELVEHIDAAAKRVKAALKLTGYV